MNIRNISIKNIFILQLIIFLVSWISFGLISISSTSELRKLYKLNQNLEHYVHYVNELGENFQLFAEEKPGVEFFKDGEDELTLKIKSNFTQLSRQLNNIKEDQYFFYNKHHYRLLEQAIENKNSLQDKFELLKTNIKTLGDEETGLVEEWFTSFNELQNFQQQFNNKEIGALIQQIWQYKQQYFAELSLQEIDNINKTGEEIKKIIKNLQAGGEVEDERTMMFTESIGEYVKLANRVLEKNIEIGYKTNAGQIAEIKTNINYQINKINTLRTAIDEKITASNKNRNITISLFWIILLTISTGGFIVLFTLMVKPFSRVRNFLSELNIGALPESLKTQNNTELDNFQEELNTYVSGLKGKMEFATSLSGGNLDVAYEPIGDSDILGKALIDLRESLIKTKKEEDQLKIENEKRRWVNEGLAKFGEVLRLNIQDINDLSFNIIKSLVQYTNAIQGGLFVYNDDNKNKITLDLTAAFAYNRRKFLTKQLELGEGLVGTCAKERKTIYLTKVPENYLSITSGLGDSNPGSILIVPLNLEGQILGVIEIASFNVLQDYEIEFVEKIAENIASTLVSVRINAQTNKLLEESKQRTAEMAEQEEELRQNMEELQASQEVAKAAENEINSVLKAINTTALVIEFGMDGKISNINDKFLEILDIPRSEVIGMKHSVFTSKVNTEKSYIDFWERLRKGEFINTIEVIKLVNGKKLWLKQAYAPVYDIEGRPVKIINIAVDITDSKQKDTLLEQQTIELTRKENEINSLSFVIDEVLIKAELSSEGEIIDFNQNFSDLFKTETKVLRGQKLFDLVNTEDIEQIHTFWPDLVEGHTHKSIIRYKKATGEDIFIMSAFTPVANEDNKIDKIYLLGQDVTEQKIDTEQVYLKQEIEKLQKLLKDNNIEI